MQKQKRRAENCTWPTLFLTSILSRAWCAWSLNHFCLNLCTKNLVRHSAEHLAGWLVFFAFLLPGLGATVPRGIRAGGVPLNGTARRSSLPLRVAAAFCSLPPRPASAPCRRGAAPLSVATRHRSAQRSARPAPAPRRRRAMQPRAAASASRRGTRGEAGRGGAPCAAQHRRRGGERRGPVEEEGRGGEGSEKETDLGKELEEEGRRERDA